MLRDFDLSPGGKPGSIGEVGYGAVMSAGAAKNVVGSRVGQPVAAVELRVVAQKSWPALLGQRDPALPVRLDSHEVHRFGIERQAVSATAAAAILEIENILASLTTEELHATCPDNADSPSATSERPVMA